MLIATVSEFDFKCAELISDCIEPSQPNSVAPLALPSFSRSNQGGTSSRCHRRNNGELAGQICDTWFVVGTRQFWRVLFRFSTITARVDSGFPSFPFGAIIWLVSLFSCWDFFELQEAPPCVPHRVVTGEQRLDGLTGPSRTIEDPLMLLNGCDSRMEARFLPTSSPRSRCMHIVLMTFEALINSCST